MQNYRNKITRKKGLWNKFKLFNVHIIEAPERKEGKEEKKFEEIMAKIFTNLCSIDLHYEESYMGTLYLY